MMTPIPSYQDRYALDEQGNVYAFPNKTHKDIKQLKPKTSNKGYLYVSLCSKDGVKDKTIHRLMAETFLGGCNALFVNHINGVRDDNRLENLELVTPSENALHGIHYLRTNNAKFTHKQVVEIKEKVQSGMKQIDVALHFDASPQTINQIIKGVCYSKSSIVEKYEKEAA